MALTEAPGSGGALVVPEYTQSRALKHSHAKAGGGRHTHSHENAAPGHRHDASDEYGGVALLPLPGGKDWDGKRDVSAEERQRLADRGAAMPDGGYPIANREDLRNAIQAYGRSSNKDAVKRHILKRARVLGLTDLLPEDWKAAKAFWLDLEIKAVDESTGQDGYAPGTLVLRGYANTWAEDRDRESFARRAFAEAKSTYMLNPVLLDQHDRTRPIGYIADASLDTIGVHITAVVPPPPDKGEPWLHKAYHDIRNRIRRALSVGGIFRKDGAHIVGMDWCETSVVTVPSNPYSIFQVAEAKGLDWSAFDEKAPVQQPGVGRGHGRHRTGPTGRARATHTHPNGITHSHAGGTRAHSHGAHAHPRAAGARGTVRHRHGAARPGHTHPNLGAAQPVVAANPPPAAVPSPTRAVGYAGGRVGGPKAAEWWEVKAVDTPEQEAEEIEARGDVGELLQGLLEALEEVIDDDSTDDAGKVANVDDILSDFVDEAQQRLADGGDDETDIPDDEQPAKWAQRLAVKAGNTQLAQALAPYVRDSKEKDMADEAGQERVPDEASQQTKAAAPTSEVTFTPTEQREMARQLQELMAEKHARELEVKAEQEAQRRLDEQAKAEETRAREEAERQKQLEAMVEQKMGAMSTGRKFAFSPATTAPTGFDDPSQRKSMASFLRDVVQAKKGNWEAYQRLQEQHKQAADSYGIKALGETTAGSGGYLVPPQYMQQGISEFRVAAAKVLPLVTSENVDSNVVMIPRATGIASVGWVGEGAAKPSTDQTFGQVAVNIFTLAGIVKVSKQLVDDANPLVDGIIRRDLGRLIGQAIDMAIINGTGTGQPTGILNTTGVLNVAVGAASIFDAVSSLLTAIETTYFGGVTAMVAHPRVVQTMRQKKDTQGRYIAEPGFVNGATVLDRNLYANPEQVQAIGTVWGIPLISDANVPSNLGAGTNEAPLIMASFPEDWFLERQGLQIDVSGEAGTSFESNQYWFRGETRCGFSAARQPTANGFLSGLSPTAG